MPFFNDPIKSPSSSEDNPIKVSPVEANKNKSPHEKGAEKSNLSPMSTFFLIYMRNFLDALNLKERHLLSSFERDSLSFHLQTLTILFDQLKSIDYNQDITFYHRLSSVWQKILRSTKIEKQIGIRTYIDITRLESLIEEIETFPTAEEKSLGYYLNKTSAISWHPVPLRQIISNLHQDHLQKNAASTLSLWTRLLEEISRGKK